MDKKFFEKLEELIANQEDEFKVAKLFREEVKNYFNSLEEEFIKSSGKLFLYTHTKNIEKFIIEFYKYVLRVSFREFRPPVNYIPIVIVALGSFAREQLCYYSDIDIMIVYKEIDGINIKPIIEKILRIAWDSGLKLGHRVHELSDLKKAANEDITIKTALIESRFLYGSKILWYEVENELNLIKKEKQNEFIKAKIAENNQRLKKYPISNEPNIKEGFGALREDNTLWWILKVLFNVNYIKDLAGVSIDEEWYREFRSALEFIFKLRGAIHFSSKRKNDILRFDIQSEVAKKLNLTDTKRIKAEVILLKKTLSSLRIIHSFCAYYIDKFSYKKDFSKFSKVGSGLYLQKNTLYFNEEEKPKFKEFLEFVLNYEDELKFNDSIIGYLKFAKLEKLDKTTKKKLFKLFYKPNTSEFLLLLYNAKALKVLFPQVAKIIDLAQFDGYHKHPVDLHLIECVRFIENIQDKYVLKVYESLNEEQKALLKLTAFFHDSGKGRKRDHSLIGSHIFERYLQKLKINKNLVEVGRKLVLYHTLMSNTAFRQDLNSDKVILEFLSKIKDELTLKMLYILTYADIEAVGGVYNSFNADLLRELFEKAIKLIKNEELLDEVSKRKRKEQLLLNNDEFLSLPVTFRKKFLKTESNLFFIRFKSSELADIAKLLFETDEFNFKIENEKRFVLHLITKKEFNLAWFLSNFLYLDLVSMDIFRINTLGKYFRIEFNEKVEIEKDYLEMLITKSFDMDRKIYYTKPKITKKNLELDFEHSLTYAKLALIVPNQKGIIMHIVKVFDDFKIDIASAKISTIKQVARDIFLIEKSKYFYEVSKDLIEKIVSKS